MLGLMRLALALALATLLTLAGCGRDDTGDVVADDPSTSSPTGTPDDGPEDDKEPTGQVDHELVEMVTETAADGEVTNEATALTDEMAIQEFSAQFTREEVGLRLLEIYEDTEVPDGQALYAAVVAIGCDVPPGVLVSSTDTGLVIYGQKVESPLQECFAPMTSVAVVLVDESVVG